MRNFGTLPFLADNAVIEVPATISAHAGDGRCRSRRSRRCSAALIAHVSAYEELALDAALHGGRARVAAGAAGAYPLVGQYDLANKMGRPADGRERAIPFLGLIKLTQP